MNSLTVIVPAYNESEGLRAFHERLSAVFAGMDELDCSVMYVDDGSRDDTWDIMCELRASDTRVATLKLSRNFGKELALTAGLDHATSDAVVVIDADLQDPPELIPQFVAEWRDGYDVIYGTRASRAGETAFKKWTSATFYKVIGSLSDTPIPHDTGDFRLLTRRALDALKGVRERQRFMKGLFTWVGFRQKSVIYARDPRYAGETKWNYWKLWNFAIDGITSFTSSPLKIATYVGLITALLSFVFAIWVTIKAMLWGDPVQGYPSLMVVVLFLGGMQLMALGVIGEYLGRLYVEAKQRPLYLIDTFEPAVAQSELVGMPAAHAVPVER